MKKLQLDLNSLQLSQHKQKKGRQSQTVPDAVASEDLEIAKLGRKYSLMICPWIATTVFQDLNGRPNCDPTSSTRFANEDSMLEGTWAELYDFLPTKLHLIMEQHSHFMNVVRTFVPIILSISKLRLSSVVQREPPDQMQCSLYAKEGRKSLVWTPDSSKQVTIAPQKWS